MAPNYTTPRAFVRPVIGTALCWSLTWRERYRAVAGPEGFR